MKLPEIDLVKPKAWDLASALVLVATIALAGANLALSNALRPAVLGYLKTLALEVASQGVTVNAVLPGYTKTARQIELAEMRAERTGEAVEDILEAPAGETAIGRMAEPEEIGRVIAFLCSPEASYVTGQAIAVEGGFVKGLF